MISNSLTITKDNSAAYASPVSSRSNLLTLYRSSSIAVTNKLSDNMNGMVTTWQQTVNTLNTQMFNGSAASINALYSLISNGKMLSGDVAISDETAQAAVEKTVYGYMIPQAWKLSNTHLSPFIVYAPHSPLPSPASQHTTLA